MALAASGKFPTRQDGASPAPSITCRAITCIVSWVMSVGVVLKSAWCRSAHSWSLVWNMDSTCICTKVVISDSV